MNPAPVTKRFDRPSNSRFYIRPKEIVELIILNFHSQPIKAFFHRRFNIVGITTRINDEFGWVGSQIEKIPVMVDTIFLHRLS